MAAFMDKAWMPQEMIKCQVFNGPLIFRFVRPLFWDLRGAVIPVGFA